MGVFEPCVIKAAHASQLVMIMRSAESDLNKSELKRWIRFDYYSVGREGNYRYIRKKLIVEELLCGADEDIPKDYKIFCFFGEPQLIQVDGSRFHYHTRNFYSVTWEVMPFRMKYPNHEIDPRPIPLENMLSVARKLSAPFSFVRVDLYAVGDRIYVGELTHLITSAKKPFSPQDFERALGRLFDRVPLQELVG